MEGLARVAAQVNALNQNALYRAPLADRPRLGKTVVGGCLHYNREGLCIDVDFSLPALRVIRSLEQVIEWRGRPKIIRCDNGPEYVSSALMQWAEKRHIKLQFIQPGKPQQNAYIERYNRTVRYDWLAHHLFDSVADVQDFATRWLWTYNHERPNMALGGITPIQKMALAA